MTDGEQQEQRRLRDLLRDKYGIDHATLQLEEESLQSQEGAMLYQFLLAMRCFVGANRVRP